MNRRLILRRLLIVLVVLGLVALSAVMLTMPAITLRNPLRNYVLPIMVSLAGVALIGWLGRRSPPQS